MQHHCRFTFQVAGNDETPPAEEWPKESGREVRASIYRRPWLSDDDE